MSEKKRGKELKWHKLDNTAKIYPVIAGSDLSGVYRVAVTLKEYIQPDLLQKTLELVLPRFESFQVRLRRGVFWYYFETNKKVPKIEEEVTYPCRYIEPYGNNQFLFRVSYYKNRINLEVFHALADGYGAINFLKELTVQYLRKAYPDNFQGVNEDPLKDTSFNTEDSYLKYYKKSDAKGYETIKAYPLKGDFLAPSVIGVIHGYIEIKPLKEVCKQYQVSITQYLTAVLLYSIYKVYLNEQPNEKPIRINIPVNLRQMFHSTTVRNFFAVIFAELRVEKENYTFSDILRITSENFSRQLTKENLERLISYNVSNEKNIFIRMVPLFLKNIGVKVIYNRSSKAFTTTLSNVGIIKLPSEYEQFIETFHLIMGVSNKQPLKCVVCSYGSKLIFTFSSVFVDTALQRCFFCTIAEHNIPVKVESNGVYHEKM